MCDIVLQIVFIHNDCGNTSLNKHATRNCSFLPVIKHKSEIRGFQEQNNSEKWPMLLFYKNVGSSGLFISFSSVPTSLVISSLLGWLWVYVLESPDADIVPHYCWGVVSFAVSTVLVIVSRPLYIVGQKCMFVKLKVAIIYTKLSRARTLSKPILILLINEYDKYKKSSIHISKFPIILHPKPLVRAIGRLEFSCPAKPI